MSFEIKTMVVVFLAYLAIVLLLIMAYFLDKRCSDLEKSLIELEDANNEKTSEIAALVGLIGNCEESIKDTNKVLNSLVDLVESDKSTVTDDIYKLQGYTQSVASSIDLIVNDIRKLVEEQGMLKEKIGMDSGNSEDFELILEDEIESDEPVSDEKIEVRTEEKNDAK